MKNDSLVKQNDTTGSIKIGSETGGTAITVANVDGALRSISGVKAGSVAEESTEAVNGAQLYSMSNTLAKYFGGGAQYKDEQWIAPEFKVAEFKSRGLTGGTQSYSNVASAFDGVNNTFKGLDGKINDVEDALLVKQNDVTSSIKVGSETGGTAITVANSNGMSRSISGVKAGSVAEESTEAVNGAQLYSMNQTLAKYFGGGAQYENGKWTAPVFKVVKFDAEGNATEGNYNTVADALTGVSNSFTNIKNEFTTAITNVNKNSLVKQSDTSDPIKIGSETGGTAITVANVDGVSRSISGVKAGALSAGSTEAVNGAQLYSMSNTLATYFGGGAQYENGNWVNPNFKVVKFNDDGTSEEGSYTNVATAFAGVSNSLTNLRSEVFNNIDQNSLLWSDDDKAFVALHGTGDIREKSKLKFLMDGDISKGSTEAVTGNQLYLMGNAFAAYLGGGSGYQDGQWIAPEFNIAQFSSNNRSIEKKSYNTVSDAFEAVNDSMSNLNDRIDGIENKAPSNSLNWNEEKGAYDAGYNGESNKITNVAAGEIAQDSTDVVNGGQLWETNEKVTAVEKKVDNIESTIKDGVISYDQDASGNKTNTITLVGGDESDPVLIDNVANGEVEEGSKEAVNGGQLYDYTKQQISIVLDDAKKYTDERFNNIVLDTLNEARQYTDMKFEALNYGIESVRKEARQAAAIGLAVSNLRYDDTPGKLSVSLGSGIWRSQSAFAVGAGYTSEDGSIRSNLSVTSAGGHFGVGVGITFTLN